MSCQNLDRSIRLILFRYLVADNDEEAYKSAVLKGEDEEFSFLDPPYEIEYKFLGLCELISLEDEDNDVVWWGFEERLNPVDRKTSFIPDKKDLRLFKPISKKGKLKLLDS